MGNGLASHSSVPPYQRQGYCESRLSVAVIGCVGVQQFGFRPTGPSAALPRMRPIFAFLLDGKRSSIADITRPSPTFSENYFPFHGLPLPTANTSLPVTCLVSCAWQSKLD